MRVAVTCALLLAPGTARAGAWARGAGDVWARLGAGVFEGEPTVQAFGAPRGEFSSVAAELYGELGLGRGLEIDASSRFVENRMAFAGVTRENSGPEDVEALLAWAPMSGTDAIALQAGARAATYGRLSADEIGTGRPERGPGGADLLAGAGWGHSFWPAPAWLDVDILWRVRLGGASTGVRTRVEVGRTLAGPVSGAISLEIMPAFGRDIDQPEGAPAPIPDAWAIGGKLLATLWRGIGVAADAAWLPDPLNAGPGFRAGIGITVDSAASPR